LLNQKHASTFIYLNHLISQNKRYHKAIMPARKFFITTSRHTYKMSLRVHTYVYCTYSIPIFFCSRRYSILRVWHSISALNWIVVTANLLSIYH